MSNRILKESICRSEEIDSLTWFEEVLFYRLMVNCDDYGRFDGREKVIKSYCFPLKDVRDNDLAKALRRLSEVGLVKRYTVRNKPVLQLVTWERHQQIRTKKSKYPGEDEADLIESDINCNQMISDDRKCYANPIQYESNPNTNPNTNSKEERACKHRYGEYDNVLLTDEDRDKLINEFPDDWKQRVDNLSRYMKSTGKTYKDHLATIRNWARRDKSRDRPESIIDKWKNA